MRIKVETVIKVLSAVTSLIIAGTELVKQLNRAYENTKKSTEMIKFND